MSIAFQQAVAAWGNIGLSPQSSGAFTPAAGSWLSDIIFDASGTGKSLVYSGSVNTPLSKLSVDDASGGNTVGIAAVNSVTGGSQTLTVSTSPTGDGVAGWGIEYSGVASDGSYSSATPGFTSAPAGSAVTVPAGSVLYAFCVSSSGSGGTLTPSVNGGVTPSNRGSGTLSTSHVYCHGEWVGTGGSITPTFAASAGNTFTVIQVILTPAAPAAVYQPIIHNQKYLYFI